MPTSSDPTTSKRGYPDIEEKGIRWLMGWNKSGEVIPAFACCAITEAESSTSSSLKESVVDDQDPETGVGRTYHLYKPGQLHGNSQNSAWHVFNGPYPIQEDAKGSVTVDFPCFCLIAPEAAIPGESVGPRSGDWRLEKNPLGCFKLQGVDPYFTSLSEEFRTGLIVLSTSSNDLVIMTPASGIAGRSGLTIYSELCDCYKEVDAVVSTGQTVTTKTLTPITIPGTGSTWQQRIYNMSSTAVEPSKIGVSSLTVFATRYIVLESCN